MAKNRIINVQDIPITVSLMQDEDYICITDMAGAKTGSGRAADIIKNWLRNRTTLEFLGTWEQIYNPDFKVVEFDHFKQEAGLHTFVISVSDWIEKTDAVGLYVKRGRYGGTFAHKDIAFEFASAISPVFKLYLIKEFQRLKTQENDLQKIEWDDIRSAKDGVSYVLVFKLSRFGRNAADVLASLQIMQDYGVNLICVEDGIDSSKEAGKLMISVLSAVAEIERENIRIQTMEGRIQKAREGRWNGGFAPYGYKLEKGRLLINEEEAEAIRIIFDKYINTDMGANGLAKYLVNHGIRKLPRQNGTNPFFDAAMIRRILKNEVYCGKIAYGKRKIEKVTGTRNNYHQVNQDNYLLVKGLHEAIVSEEDWQVAQSKLKTQAKRYEHVNTLKAQKVHLLSGLVKCPMCGAGMYGNKSIKYKNDGTKYKDFYYYGCKHRDMMRGHKCDYRKQINEEVLDAAVVELISRLVSNRKFSDLMMQKINTKVDTTEIDHEINTYEKELKKCYGTREDLAADLDNLDPDDRHYSRMKADLNERIYKMYDRIDDIERQLQETRMKKAAIETDKITADNIYKALVFFDKLYENMNDQEKRQFMVSLIEEIQIHEQQRPNGQWLNSIKFKLPVIDENLDLGLDNETQNESCVLLERVSNRKADSFVKLNVKMEDYYRIKDEEKAQISSN